MRIIPANPCSGIKKRTTIVKPKEAISPDKLAAADELLKARPDYHRFVKIFHSSGSRIVEMLKVKAIDVFPEQNYFYRIVLKKKSRIIVPVRTTIPASALHLWREQLGMCKNPEDFLFGYKFRPGKKAIGIRSVQTYWRQLVQKPLGVKQGIYVLKHQYLTELKRMHGSGTAASHAAHSGTLMVDTVYDLDRENSQHERIKQSNIHFVPLQPLQSTEKCQSVAFAINI